MAGRPSLSDRTRELRAEAVSLSSSDPLGGLLVKSFDLLGSLQKEDLAATELSLSLQSMEAECEAVRGRDEIPSSPLHSLVVGLVETLQGTVGKMVREGRIRGKEESPFPDDSQSSSSSMAETRENSSAPIYPSLAAAASTPPLLDIAAVFAAASAATATTETKKAKRGARKVLPSSASPSSSLPSLPSMGTGSRPRRSGVKPAGYWAAEITDSLSTLDDDVIPPPATLADAVRRALLPVETATENGQSPLFATATQDEWEVKKEVKEEPTEEEEEVQPQSGDWEMRGTKRKAEGECTFSDIEEEDEAKPSRATLSPLLNLQHLLSSGPSTPSTPSGLPPGSFSTVEDGGMKKFRCEFCKTVHAHFHNLKAHMRSHTGDRPYGCETCGTRFFRSEHLKRHQQGQCGSRPHLCTICGKRFAEEETLRDHMILHEHQRRANGEEGGEGKRQFEKNGEGEYECPHCTQTFKYLCHIERHMRTHTGERPFHCEECGKSFGQMTTFVQHKRVHSGELPFPCPQCGHRFRTLGCRNAHLKKKHGELLYVCQSCGEKFEKTTQLKEHRLTKHPEGKGGGSTVVAGPSDLPQADPTVPSVDGNPAVPF